MRASGPTCSTDVAGRGKGGSAGPRLLSRGGAKKRKGGSGSEPEAREPRAAAAEGREQNERMDFEDEEKTADATHAGSAISRDRSSLLMALHRRRSDTSVGEARLDVSMTKVILDEVDRVACVCVASQ